MALFGSPLLEPLWGPTVGDLSADSLPMYQVYQLTLLRMNLIYCSLAMGGLVGQTCTVGDWRGIFDVETPLFFGHLPPLIWCAIDCYRGL